MPSTVNRLSCCLIALLLIAFPAVAQNVRVPEGLKATEFSSNKLTPCVACIGVAPTGEVFAGVDRIGSLGKGAGHGSIIKLYDEDNDGVSEKHTVFAKIDNPRGIIPVGDKVYVLHTKWGQGTQFDGMFLSVLTDADGDGKADGPPKHLVKEISTRKFNQARGVDHTTNGIRMGIDGWIYIAVGDFGFVDAVGTDGTKLTMYGGGVVRVRPDGTELETYVHGLRNIYDVAIDPFMNLFTRGNTNDGGGWNIRFIHEIQSAEYGYPVLFKRYTDEILPALVDVGGGSGTGSMFFSEPGWPAKYNNVPMMCDWGRGQLFIHRVTPDGASFTQQQEEFIKCGRITDVDCDGSGRLFLGSWGKSGFKGGTDGYTVRVVPAGWKYKPFPDLEKASDAALVELLQSESAKTRLHAQQALLARGASAARTSAVQKVAESKSASHASRVAAIFTLKQLAGAKSHDALLTLAKDPKVAEHALRALADRKTQVKGVPVQPFVDSLKSSDPRVQVAAAIALGRLGQKSAIPSLLAVANPPKPTPLPKPEPAAAPEKVDGFKSAVIKGADTARIDVDITGWKQLYLVIGQADNGNSEDHGSWFEPTLITQSGKKIQLTDLKWKKAKGGWGKTLVNKDCTDKPLKTHDGKAVAFGIGSHAPSVIQYNKLPKNVVRFQAYAGLSAGGRKGSVEFLVNNTGSGAKGGKADIPEGPHATPNSAIVLPHVAIKALVALDAAAECVKAIDGPNRQAALWALRYMHNNTAVDGLIGKLNSAVDSETQQRIAMALIRLIHRERPYDGSHWWGTRPDTRGPYYYPTPWSATDKIKAALLAAFKSGNPQLQHVIATLSEKDRAPIEGLPKAATVAVAETPQQPAVDLEKIKNQKGQVGKMAVEDVLLALEKVKGNAAKGAELFTRQGCVACHTLKKGEPLKGPYMGQIGSIMKRDQIAMSILRPSAAISQGFKTVQIQTKKGEVYLGFVSKRLSDLIEIRDIAGKITQLKPTDVKSETLMDMSMMPPGLANGLSLEELASLVSFLERQKQ